MSKTLALVIVLVFLIASSIIVVLSVSGTTAENTWTAKAPMPTARTLLGAAEVNGKIYAIGGFSDLNVTEEYDPITDTWTTKAVIPSPRFSFAIAAYQNKIYCMGGLTGRGAPFSSSVTGAIEVYDPATNTWEIKKPMPTPRAQSEANVVNDKIYLIGGRTGGQHSTVSTNQVYDPITEKWETKKSMPYPVVSFSSVVVDNKIYVMGGQDEFNDPINLDILQIYDCTSDSWTIGTPLPTIVLNSAACTISEPRGYERIYLIGGQLGTHETGGNRTNMVQVFNPENNIWSVGVSMLTARDGLAAAVVNNTVYAIGGVGGNFLLSGEGYAENEAYTPIVDQPPFSSPSQTPLPTQSFPTLTVVAISTVAVVVIGFCLLIYFKKRRLKSGGKP